MLQKIKYAVIYIVLILIIAFRLKLQGEMNPYGLNFMLEDNLNQLNYLGFAFKGYEGSITLFFAVGILYFLVVYDFLYNTIQERFFLFNSLIFSFSLFAFEETMIRILATCMIIVFLLKLIGGRTIK